MSNAITSFLQEHYRFLTFWVTSNVMDIQDQQLCYSPRPGANHIHWLFGHMITHMDMAPTLLADSPDSLPAQYRELFHKGSKPDPEAKHYPDFQDMISEWRRLGKQAVKTIKLLQDEDLEQPSEREWEDEELQRMFPDKSAILRGNLVHMAYHNGQISQLKSLTADERR